jgi:SAM-dependent methyltransferase
MIPTLSGINFAEIAQEIKKHANESKNEEDLRIRVENLLRSKVFDKLGIPWASYEHKSKKLSTIKTGRKDALYGRVIIEYEPPGKFKSKAGFEEAKNQVKRYIEEEAGTKEEYGKFFGIVIDGYSIAFVRFRKNKWEDPIQPSDINEQTISTFLRAISGLQRKPIDVDYLLLDFGPRSELSKKVILSLYEILLKSKSKRTQMLFDDWRRVFSQVCSYSKDKLTGLIEYYDLQDSKIIDVEKLMFAVHTYYTFLMKLLTSEIVSFFNPIFGSFLERLESSFHRKLEDFRTELIDLEEGGIISKIGIRNFLEADYFAWYLDEWNRNIAELIIEVIRKLREYEPGTAELDPDRVKDLFKRLYQNLVPKKVRHDLGEYFTPDWLAELLMNEVGYDGNPDKRVLDPACGSGTFLVLTIKRIRDYAEEHFYSDKKELLKKITNNVVGIDLNPLAVLASRANYIIALGELIRSVPKEGIEIPVYLSDSILVSRGISIFTGKPEFVLETSVGKFWVREELINKNLWSPLLNAIEFCLKNEYSITDFKNYVNSIFANSGFVSKDSYGAAVRLYEQFLKLEKRNLDRIWTKVIKNSFAPLLIGQFDYVVGNPPWINWENLPDNYKKLCMNIWDAYGLFPFKGWKGKLGSAKYDISMVFVYASIDKYVKQHGKLAFLITQSLFQSDAGYGFRKFYYTKNENLKQYFRIEKVYDLVDLNPFEGATNRTSFFIATKGYETKYPIDYIIWKKIKPVDIFGELPDITKKIKILKWYAKPVIPEDENSKWLIYEGSESLSTLQKILGKSVYRGLTGSYTEGANGIYWIEIVRKISENTVLVKNIISGVKKSVKEISLPIETDLIYPLLRGGEVDKWFTTQKLYLIFTSKHLKNEIKEGYLKTKLPKTYNFLNTFRSILDKRSSYSFKLKPQGYPFYTIYGSKEMLEPFKVVWQRMGSKLKAAVISTKEDKMLGGSKPIIPQETIIFVPLKNEKEAHYICAILNSSIIEFVLKSYSMVGGKSFASTHILDNINIKKFEKNNKLHIKLAELSKKAHELKKKIYEEDKENFKKELIKIENQIDETVAKLYKISSRELKEIRKILEKM